MLHPIKVALYPFSSSLLQTVNKAWNALDVPADKLYAWDPKSTYIKSPPFFENLVSVSHFPLFIWVDFTGQIEKDYFFLLASFNNDRSLADCLSPRML